ncbi:hypothetical protein Ciccas_013307, partial [Cichlidogyrus casuarinus]
FCCVYSLNPVCNDVIVSEYGCLITVHAWIWDARISACKMTYYYGCRFRSKGFPSKHKCEAACHYKPEPNLDAWHNPVCKLPPDSGEGYCNIHLWAYDLYSGTCMDLPYGGFGGNKNRFCTKQECEKACVPPPTPICEQPIDRGTGGQCLIRWGYDTRKGACVPFYYGGSGGRGYQLKRITR